jgi:hypothetical protein
MWGRAHERLELLRLAVGMEKWLLWWWMPAAGRKGAEEIRHRSYDVTHYAKLLEKASGEVAFALGSRNQLVAGRILLAQIGSFAFEMLRYGSW